MAKEFFSETQKLQRMWFWIISLDLIVVGIILTFVFSKSSHNSFEVLPPIIIVLIAFSFVIWIFISSKLIVTIDSDGINYRYPVFKPKWQKIPREAISSFSIKKYDAIFDYGGWGYKNSKKGKCVTIQGDTGVFLELKTGEHILIGIQNKEGIEMAMNRLMRKPFDN